MFIALCIQHAKAYAPYCHLWLVRLYHIFPHYPINLFLNINQLDALNFIISLFQASTCFEHMCSSSSLNLCTGRPPIGVMIPETVIYNFALLTMSTWCSKHVEALNKLIIKFSASSCLILINKYIEMHGQKNIKICNYLCFGGACCLHRLEVS